MKILTKKEIKNLVSDELRYWIYDETQNEIIIIEHQIKKFDFSIQKFNEFIKRIKICADLTFSFDSNIDWLLNELVKFKKFVSQKEFNFSGSAIMEELDAHIQKIKLENYSESDFSTTEGDISILKKEMEEEIRQSEQRKKEFVEKRQQEIQAKKEKVEKWRLENMNTNFDATILDELKLRILKEALQTEFKCISISWLQRRFSMGYAKAGSIVDFYEQNDIVSSFEQACKLGVGKYGRIIRVDLE